MRRVDESVEVLASGCDAGIKTLKKRFIKKFYNFYERMPNQPAAARERGIQIIPS